MVKHDVNAMSSEFHEKNDVESKLLGEANLTSSPFEGKAQTKSNNVEEKGNKTEVDEILCGMAITEDVRCGFWIFKGSCVQGLANQTTYVLLYGLVGCVFSMTYAYFNGTLTTLEKRFKIPSKNTGIIAIGNNISQMIVSAVLSYYAGKGHRPRWIAFGIMTIVAFCMLTAAPHFLYGPGEDALALTSEFGGIADENATIEILEQQRGKALCRDRSNETACMLEEGNLAPQAVLFLAEVISGIGGALYYTLGISYMDDNTKKSKTPALLSLSYFFHMLGPAIGYALASFCLRLYIAPQLRPVIGDGDPRWLGAWWLGWLLLGAALFVCGILFAMLPKELPRAKARRLAAARKREELSALKAASVEPEAEQASFGDMLTTFRRLLQNKTLMCNHISSIFYYFGYTPYWIFTPKYIEIQYRQSAATSSMVTGTVALAFSALGVLLSGFVISKYKPSARYMAAWNVLVGLLTVAGCMAYAFIGCPGNEHSMVVNIPESGLHSVATCNSACYCDYVPFSPICGEDNMTYISACHAGCREEVLEANGKKIYNNCSCIVNEHTSILEDHSLPYFRNMTELALLESSGSVLEAISNSHKTKKSLDFLTATTSSSYLPNSFMATTNKKSMGGHATPGACPVNCFTQFVIFLAVMCGLKFIGATGRASNFLVTVRCVPEQDKTAAMGLGMMLACMLTFIPSPIFFGWLLDRLCLVWGKTCTNKGNCWLYDPLALRYILNFTAAAFIFVGTIFDGGVWYLVKNLKIFDEEVKEQDRETVGEEEAVPFAGKE